jgi:beta-galactosidase
MVFINGEFLAQRPNGYTNFYVKADPYLRYGEPNTIRVQARAHQDSRWYTGAGIYRDTKLIVADLVHVALDGVRITTPDVEAARAVVAIATTVENEDRARPARSASRRGSSTPAGRWSRADPLR